MFIGQYNHQMDDKGRLRIPPVFRRALGDNPMIFCNYFEKNIWIFPREDFNETVLDRFKAYDMLDEEMNDVMRIVKEETPEIVQQGYDSDCSMTLRIRRDAMPRLRARLEKVETLQIE